jgi:hypothetical protein
METATAADLVLQIVPPGANITISVVFLPRMEGAVDTTFSIHTSAGTFVFQVFGRGIPNPYKVSPLVGVKVRNI